MRTEGGRSGLGIDGRLALDKLSNDRRIPQRCMAPALPGPACHVMNSQPDTLALADPPLNTSPPLEAISSPRSSKRERKTTLSARLRAIERHLAALRETASGRRYLTVAGASVYSSLSYE